VSIKVGNTFLPYKDGAWLGKEQFLLTLALHHKASLVQFLPWLSGKPENIIEKFRHKV
jgi:hypothetical protein